VTDEERRATERAGYETAVAALTDVADRTGSVSARYWAEYLQVDPDGRAPELVRQVVANETGGGRDVR
jgi:hypothetical protein